MVLFRNNADELGVSNIHCFKMHVFGIDLGEKLHLITKEIQYSSGMLLVNLVCLIYIASKFMYFEVRKEIYQ